MAGLHYQGLKYELLDYVQQHLPDPPDDAPAPDAKLLFWQIQQMERAALQVLNTRD